MSQSPFAREQTKRVLSEARDRARGRIYVEPEHILLVLLQLNERGIPGMALELVGLSIPMLQSKAEEAVAPNPATISTTGQPVFSFRVRNCLERAMFYALKMEHPKVTEDHLFFATLLDPDVAGLVDASGASPESLRDQVDSLIRGPQ